MDLKKFNIDLEFNDDIDCILGQLVFKTGPIAHRLRKLGMDIPTKCEREQAFVLYWLLSLYKEHGEKWPVAVTEFLKIKKEESFSNAVRSDADKSDSTKQPT